MTRVYLGATVAGLRDLLRDGQLGPFPALAVAGSAEGAGADEIEDLEYEALLAAAEASAALAGRGGLRVVVVADVPPATVDIGAGNSAVASEARACDVVLSRPLTRDLVAAIHVDETGEGDPQDRDLLWYANQEIEDWLATQAP